MADLPTFIEQLQRRAQKAEACITELESQHTNTGPFIYRTPSEGEVLEHPFRVPDAVGIDHGTEDIRYWHFYFEEWNYCHRRKLDDGDIWEPPEVPPSPELIEIAARLRAEKS